MAGNPVKPEDSEQQMKTPFAMISWARSAWMALATMLLLAGMPVHAADDFLEPQQAFQFSARAAGPDEIEVQFQIAPGYYMYRQALKAAAEGATVQRRRPVAQHGVARLRRCGTVLPPNDQPGQGVTGCLWR